MAENGMHQDTGKTYRVTLGSEVRDLPIVCLGKVSVALFNLLGDHRVTEAAADELVKRLPEADVLVTPEVKSVPLAHALAVRSDIPYVVARKTRKPYMVDAIGKTTLSITTGKPQDLFIDGGDIPKLKGKRAVILDDVVSTGGTLKTMTELLADVGARIVGTMAVLTEGEKRDDVIALAHLPLFDPQGERL